MSDWRNVLLVEHTGGTMDPADPDNEQNADGGPGSGPDPTTYQAIRMVTPLGDGGTHETVFVSYVDGETEYYDINADPYEMNNTVSTLSPGDGHAARERHRRKGCKGTAACWAAQHT